jgi:ribosomal protein L14E/L6E/L27E
MKKVHNYQKKREIPKIIKDISGDKYWEARETLEVWEEETKAKMEADIDKIFDAFLTAVQSTVFKYIGNLNQRMDEFGEQLKREYLNDKTE